MALLEGKTPAERRKVMILLVLGGIVLLAIVYNFVLSGSTPKRTPKGASRATTRATGATTNETVTPQEIRETQPPRRVVYQPAVFRPEPEIGRNIFAYYSASAPSGKGTGGAPAASSPPVATLTPPPTPVPPSLILAGISPSSRYGRTGDFALEVSGNKFTPETRIYFNGGELPTTFENAQRLRAQVPSSLVSSAGGRTVLVRTPDGSLFSNTVNFNVLPPPMPQLTYVGFISRRTNRDTAVLMNSKKELLSYQRGDTIEGRFRLTNISEKSIELTDTELGIKHSLPFVENRNAASSLNNRPQRPISPPPVDNDPVDDGEDN